MIASFFRLTRGLGGSVLWFFPFAVLACDDLSPCRKSMTISGQQVVFYEAKGVQSLDQVRELIVIVHGQNGSSLNAVKTGVNLAKKLGRYSTALVVAPQFLEDSKLTNMPMNLLVWSRKNNWRRGDLSNGPADNRVSSFTVMDLLLDAYLNDQTIPNIQSVLILGHSAGGQYVQRYAIGTDIDRRNPSSRFVFGVANPSTYMYLNLQRPLPDISLGFDIPTESSCAWNNGHYGFGAPNDYMSQYSESTRIQRYLQRSVIYALGSLDSDPLHPQLGRSACAKLQGDHRLDRGLKYFSFLETFFPTHRHALVVVDGVGHEASRMLTSEALIRQLKEQL